MNAVAPEVLLDIASYLKPRPISVTNYYGEVTKPDLSLLRLSQVCSRFRFLAHQILPDVGLVQHFNLVPGMAPYPPTLIQGITIQGNDFRDGLGFRNPAIHVPFVSLLSNLHSLTLLSSAASNTNVLENIIAALPARGAVTSLTAHAHDEQGHDGILTFRLQPNLFVNLTFLDTFCMVNVDDYLAIGQCVHLETLKLRGCFDDNREAMFPTTKTMNYKALTKLRDFSLIGYGLGHTLGFWNAIPDQVLQTAEILVWPFSSDEEGLSELIIHQQWDLVKGQQAIAVVSFLVVFDESLDL
ncbi:UNVERIFIED_CONTAM: hypothetical protein HDU68_007577 [Siphonaria sp. JEL0065]|nr:hypothetical protein HDU68_007577 [Siphonaria sp. JEL0065]